MDGSTSYDADVILWSREQAAALRAGDFSRLDIEHLADEIEDVGRSEKRELASRMARLLTHLLKWKYQPERQSRSWTVTIRHQRERLGMEVKETPSLKSLLGNPDWQRAAWIDAVDQAALETGLEPDVFPDACPWTFEDVLTPDWLPN